MNPYVLEIDVLGSKGLHVAYPETGRGLFVSYDKKTIAVFSKINPKSNRLFRVHFESLERAIDYAEGVLEIEHFFEVGIQSEPKESWFLQEIDRSTLHWKEWPHGQQEGSGIIHQFSALPKIGAIAPTYPVPFEDALVRCEKDRELGFENKEVEVRYVNGNTKNLTLNV